MGSASSNYGHLVQYPFRQRMISLGIIRNIAKAMQDYRVKNGLHILGDNMLTTFNKSPGFSGANKSQGCPWRQTCTQASITPGKLYQSLHISQQSIGGLQACNLLLQCQQVSHAHLRFQTL